MLEVNLQNFRSRRNRHFSCPSETVRMEARKRRGGNTTPWSLWQSRVSYPTTMAQCKLQVRSEAHHHPRDCQKAWHAAIESGRDHCARSLVCVSVALMLTTRNLLATLLWIWSCKLLLYKSVFLLKLYLQVKIK